MLEAAAVVVVERGVEGLRYQDVSAASGVPVTSLRHYFPTIDGLRHEALTHSIRTELHTLEGVVAEHDDPWVQLCEFIRHALGVDAQERRHSWLLWLEYWRLAAREPEVGPIATEVYEAWYALVERIIQRGVDAGIFACDVPADEAAFQVSAFIDAVGPEIAIAPHDEDTVARAFRRIESATRRLLAVPHEVGRQL